MPIGREVNGVSDVTFTSLKGGEGSENGDAQEVRKFDDETRWLPTLQKRFGAREI